MNKYDAKIHEIAPDDSTIYELIQRPARSAFFRFVNILFDNIPWVADGITSKGAYYLIFEGTKVELVQIERHLNMFRTDVTSAVQASAHKRFFEFDGNRYTFYRNVK